MTTASFKVVRYLIAGLMMATLIAVLFESCTLQTNDNTVPSGLADDVPICRHWMLAEHCEKVSR
jgi:hypothetical protein